MTASAWSETGRNVVGNRLRIDGTFTPSSSYPTNGEPISLATIGLVTCARAVGVMAGYETVYDYTANKLKIFDQTSNALPLSISKTFAIADMTDGGGTSGFIDFASNALPIGAIPVSATLAVSGAFTGDTSAVWKLGVSGDLDRYSVVSTNSCFTAITTSSLVKNATAVQGTDAARTPRLTITTAADFTAAVTDATGAAVCTLYYLLPTASVGALAEVPNTTDLSAVPVRMTFEGT